MDILTHGPRKYPTSALLKSSAGLGWSTISAELRSHGVSETPVIVPQHTELSFAIVGNEDCLVRRSGAGQSQEIRAGTETFCLSPIGVGDNEITIRAPIPQSMHFYLPTTLFRQLADDFNLPQMLAHSIRYLGGVRDDLVNQIARSIFAELMHETTAGRMFVEAASLTLAARLVHDYCDSGRSTPTRPDWHHLDHARLRHVLEYIAAHLSDDMTLADLAGVACVSTFHFTRLFKLSMGMSPFRYVSRMRLDKAMAEIASGRRTLAQVAFDARFSSQSSFTRAFRRATGMTPAEYRRHRR